MAPGAWLDVPVAADWRALSWLLLVWLLLVAWCDLPVVDLRGCLVIAPGVLVRRGCSRCDWLAFLVGWFAVVWVVLGWLVVAGDRGCDLRAG